ncbi:MAG TPA: cupin domain-containing protein [Lysobacter sp.]|nr:cupin domain-containing protein [Lysobacter sp.]
MTTPQLLILSLGALLLQPAQAQDPEEPPAQAAPAQTTQAHDEDQAHAPAQAQARALAHTAKDPQLQWGPCPEFMPEGCAIAVLHGDPGQDNADVFFRVPAGAQIPLHWHTSAERMVLVEGELQVTYAGQEPVALRPGTYAYGPAKLAHEGRCGEAAACTLFIAFEQPVDAFPGSPPQ